MLSYIAKKEGIPMNCLERDMKNLDGTIDTLIISSNDNTYPLDVNKTYKLANNTYKKENKIISAYKNSILGVEIGVKAEGFSTITILATLVAIGTLCIMYLFCRV